VNAPSNSLLQGRLGGSTPVRDALEKALDGERITDDDAATLLRSRDLVAVGRVANELRNRTVDPGRITFIVDRNLNYTNICVTDCDFCAFYRSPGDVREGYLLPKPVIFKKIEETLAIGGTGVLMQGGHHPDLGIDYYEDLFRSIKARYPIHLHALSPPEIQHIARRSKLSIPDALTRLRDAGREGHRQQRSTAWDPHFRHQRHPSPQVHHQRPDLPGFPHPHAGGRPQGPGKSLHLYFRLRWRPLPQ